MRRLLIVLAVLAGCGAAAPVGVPAAPVMAQPGSRTTWVLEPNLAYDSLCFLNLLSGDPWYLGFGFADELAPWIAALPPAEHDAIARMRGRLKASDHLMSAYLSLVLSAADPRTLADLRHVVDDDRAWAELRRTYLATSYGADDDFAVMAEIRPDLGLALRYLETAGFVAYWRSHALPQVEAAIAQQAPVARRYDVIGADEALLGRRLDTDRITAYVLAYVRPHGIRITGWRFLNDFKVPVEITVKTALHELLHPPFPRVGEVDKLLQRIEEDPYFQRLVKDHDPSFGYTTAAGLLEEDLVTAIDVYNAHQLGLLPDLAAYWPAHDDGIHVVAFLLFQQIARNHRAGETYPEFLLRLEREQKLTPGGLEAQFLAEPAHYVVKALAKGR